MDDRVKLGDKIQCKYTGLVGVATGRCEYPTHFEVCLQPPIDKDGKWVAARWMAESRVTILPT